MIYATESPALGCVTLTLCVLGISHGIFLSNKCTDSQYCI